MTKETAHVAIDSNDAQHILGDIIQHPEVESWEIVNLPSADFRIGRAGIERKTPSDFASSITDDQRNIYDQCRRMADDYEIAVILVEGDLGSFNRLSHSGINWRALHGVMASLYVRHGIPTIPCGDRDGMIDIAVRIGRKTIEHPSTSFVRAGAVTDQRKSITVRALSVFPHVGSKKASLIAELYPSLSGLFSVNVDELMEIEGIGKTTAKAVYYGLRGVEYDNENL